MDQQVQSAIISLASFSGAVLMCVGIYVREKASDARAVCGYCNREEDARWKWRHAVRWLVVCLLLLEAFHHARWTLLPSVMFGKDYILPDIGVAVLGVVYGVSLLSHSRDLLFRTRSGKTDNMPLE